MKGVEAGNVSCHRIKYFLLNLECSREWNVYKRSRQQKSLILLEMLWPKRPKPIAGLCTCKTSKLILGFLTM
jgi:hypothetical protein